MFLLGMSNILAEDKRQQVLALGRLGWSLRRIERATGVRRGLQELTDMKSLPDAELKSLATRPGPKQYLAFDEMARRVRDNPSGWTQQQKLWAWSAVEFTRGPNAREMEWAFLKWSQRLNDVEPELDQGQQMRIEELERHLDQDSDSLEVEYHNAIGEEIRRQG